jgi:CRISPR/Cas system CSM-associated protein Csm2 small subunit
MANCNCWIIIEELLLLLRIYITTKAQRTLRKIEELKRIFWNTIELINNKYNQFSTIN